MLGDEKYLFAIRNAWDMLEETQQIRERRLGTEGGIRTAARGRSSESLTAHREHFETPCGCYAHMKLARLPAALHRRSAIRRRTGTVLYNTILGSIEPSDDGDYFYYSDYQSGARKGYYKKKSPCCSGRVRAGGVPICGEHLLPGFGTNLRRPCRAFRRCDGRRAGCPVRVTQSTGYPNADSLRTPRRRAEGGEFAVHVRIPAWLSGAAAVRVNGKSMDVAAERKTFATVRGGGRRTTRSR